MEKISSKEFTYTFSDIWNSPDRRFCFVLGAGASRSSGIRTGAELAKIWLDEIEARLIDQPGRFQALLKKHGIKKEHPGLNYPEIYQERFKLDITSGLDFINKEIENKTPGYGYSVLAQILAEKQHNIVITTNFDNLSEEALYTYTYKRPLICGHESLAVFAKPSITRPLIIKIHRDRFFDPQSLPNEIENMNKLWKDALNNIFSVSTPIFIGYGGNDGSLMGYLENVSRLNNIFWCERKGSEVSERVEKLLEKHNGHLVEIEGFDELMFSVQDQLGLPLLNKEIVDIAYRRAVDYLETVTSIRSKQAKSSDKTTQEAAERMIEKAGEEWWYWDAKAENADTNEEKESIYEEGVAKLPKNSDLITNYGYFLFFTKRDFEKAEKTMLNAFVLSPKNQYNNCNLGTLNAYYRKNFEEAEKFFRMALGKDPTNPHISTSFATFLFTKTKNFHEAEKYFKISFEYGAGDADINANYAGFLLFRNDQVKAKYHLELSSLYGIKENTKLEILFYKYAYQVPNTDFLGTRQELLRLLKAGHRSIPFDLQLHVDTSILKGHPEPGMLQHIADIITKDAPLGDLCL